MNNKEQAEKIQEQHKRLNELAIDNLRKDETIAGLRATIEQYKETVALQRRLLGQQATIFTSAFDYMQDLQQQMRDISPVQGIASS
jgi:hypothetical protein